jgi:hypothetical protein
MKRMAVFMIAGLVWIFPSHTTSAPETPARKPNLILIVTDDLDARALAMLPRLRTLFADKGATFANAFVTTPTCCPLRASILRGQYAHNHQVRTNELPDGGFQKFYDWRQAFLAEFWQLPNLPFPKYKAIRTTDYKYEDAQKLVIIK